MKEKEIIDEAVKLLERREYVVWKPPKIKFYKTDIFGLFDLIGWKYGNFVFVQVTTYSNMSHRKRKIKDFQIENNVWNGSIFVWGWDDKIREFVEERIA